MKDLTWVLFTGSGHRFTASTFSGSVWIPFSDITWPKYVTCFPNNTHFLAFSFNPAEWSFSKTSSRLYSISSNVFPYTITSSKYTRHTCHCRPDKTVSISRSKVAGALHSPNGMTLNSYNPSRVAKAVLFLSTGSSSTCQYPAFKSRVLNHLDPLSWLSDSSIRGRG